MQLDGVKWDASGLATVVVQDRLSGEVRMVAHANEQALRHTIESGQATFFSRSRNTLWRKGETSGNTMAVAEVWLDCDGDALVYLVDPAGPSCHTGRRTCFFRRADAEHDPGAHASPFFVRLFEVLEARRSTSAERSYTKSLVDAGPAKIAEKVREEADELGRAVEGETDERVIAEAADLVYHTLVALLARHVTLRDVEAELARRFGVSGHDEKESR